MLTTILAILTVYFFISDIWFLLKFPLAVICGYLCYLRHITIYTAIKTRKIYLMDKITPREKQQAHDELIGILKHNAVIAKNWFEKKFNK